MTDFDNPNLTLLMQALKAGDVSTSSLRELLARYFMEERSEAEINEFRLGLKHFKKLRDEVLPVSRLLDELELRGSLNFPLNSDVPDAWFFPEAGDKIGIEVTRALGRSEFERMKELVWKGIGRGFVRLQDNASEADFVEEMAAPRSAYSTDEALKLIIEGVCVALCKKNKERYKGMWLIITAPLSLLPAEQWSSIRGETFPRAKILPFGKIFVLSDEEGRVGSVKIKSD